LNRLKISSSKVDWRLTLWLTLLQTFCVIEGNCGLLLLGFLICGRKIEALILLKGVYIGNYRLISVALQVRLVYYLSRHDTYIEL
jgi:hypothetical protein